jgi:hypothetical protein
LNPGREEFFSTLPHRFWGTNSFCTTGSWSFSLGKSGRDVVLTTYLHLTPRLDKTIAIPLLPLWVFIASSRAKFTNQ